METKIAIFVVGFMLGVIFGWIFITLYRTGRG